MLFELSLIPVGGSAHSSGEIARALKLIHHSGVRYQLTPTATCLEGEWDEVMDLIKKVHGAVRENVPHLMTLIKVEDDAGESGKITKNVDSVAQKMKEPGATVPDPITAT
jgi:uncharacterized protein (TIGR00106 family)